MNSQMKSYQELGTNGTALSNQTLEQKMHLVLLPLRKFQGF